MQPLFEDGKRDLFRTYEKVKRKNKTGDKKKAIPLDKIPNWTYTHKVRFWILSQDKKLPQPKQHLCDLQTNDVAVV